MLEDRVSGYTWAWYNCIFSRSQLDEGEANEKFLEAMLLIADVRDVKEKEDSRTLGSWLSSQN